MAQASFRVLSVSGLTVNFEDTSTGTVLYRNWNFGEGTRLTSEKRVAWTYSQAGTYPVTVTAIAMDGNDTSAPQRVTVGSAAPPPPDSPSLITFTVAASGVPEGHFWQAMVDSDKRYWSAWFAHTVASASMSGIPAGKGKVTFRDSPSKSHTDIRSEQAYDVTLEHGKTYSHAFSDVAPEPDPEPPPEPEPDPPSPTPDPVPPPPKGTKTAGFFVFGKPGTDATYRWIRDSFMPYIVEGDFILFNSGAKIDGPTPPAVNEADIHAAVQFVKSLPKKMRLVLRTTGLPNVQAACNMYKRRRSEWQGVLVGVSPTYESGQVGEHYIDPRSSKDSRHAQAWKFAIDVHQAYRRATDDAGLEHWGFAGGNLVLSSDANGKGLPYGHMAKTQHVVCTQYQGATKGGQYPQRWKKEQELMKAAGAAPREQCPQNCTVGTTLLNAMNGQDEPWVSKPWTEGRKRIRDATYFYYENGATGYVVQYQINNNVNIQRTIEMIQDCRGGGTVAAQDAPKRKARKARAK